MATYQSILDASIEMVCEDAENGDCEDYKGRAVYILATFASECRALDRRLRDAAGEEPPTGEIPLAITLSDEFPLKNELIPAAVYYLCAMLVIDENEALSDKFFELYSDAISSLQASIPAPSTPPLGATLEQIANRYVGAL